MAAVQDTQIANETEALSFAGKTAEFLQKNRKIFLAALAALIGVFVIFVIVQAALGSSREKALGKIDEFSRRYEVLRVSLNSEEPVTEADQADLDLLLGELAAFTDKNSGFPAARAHYIIAGIYGDQKKWAEAEAEWKETARIAAKTYLAPISVFNAAVAAEERGNTDAALELYTSAANYGNRFFGAVRAQFSIARLEEARNNTEAALEAYRNLVAQWPEDPLWANLAQSRIIALSN